MPHSVKQVHPAQRFFSAEHPLNSHLSLRFLEGDRESLSVALTAPDAFLVDSLSGEIHSGLATLVLDTVMGGLVLAAIEVLQPIATTGLTTQHLRRPRRGEELLCNARCEGIHSDMAHISGQVIAAETGEVLSTATGLFMIGTRSKPLGTRV